MRHAIGRQIRRHRLGIAASALAFYAVAVPVTFLVFPDNNIWLAMLIICASAAQALLSIADLMEDE